MEWDKPFFLFQRNRGPVAKHAAHSCCWCGVIVHLDTLPPSGLTGKAQQGKHGILRPLIHHFSLFGLFATPDLLKVLAHLWIGATVMSSKSSHFASVQEVSYAVFQIKAVICNNRRTPCEISFIKHLPAPKKIYYHLMQREAKKYLAWDLWLRGCPSRRWAWALGRLLWCLLEKEKFKRNICREDLGRKGAGWSYTGAWSMCRCSKP